MTDGYDTFPVLTGADLAAIEQLGERRRTAPGEYLYREGDLNDFFVVVSGEVEILTRTADGGEQVIATQGAGRFLGELNLLSGLRVFVSARVVEAGEVLVVPRPLVQQLIATRPGLGDTILGAFIARRADLMEGAASSLRVIASRFSPDSQHIAEFLARSRIPREWVDPDRDEDVEGILRQLGVTPSDLPVVVSAGKVLRRATAGTLAEHLGLTVDNLGPDKRCVDLVVVGAGPAGLAAAVYGASEGLRTLAIEMFGVGGQAGSSSRIENYLGFPTGISGGDLTQRAEVQAEKFGARFANPCEAVSLGEEAGHLVVGFSDGSSVAGRAVIAASGARYRRLEADGLESCEGQGVYYAATDLEARLCASSPVVVVGGGNSAGQAALFLAEQGSPVSIVIRGPDLSAGMSRYLLDRVQVHDRIDVWTKTQVTGLEGPPLRSVHLSGPEGETRVECAGLFSFIGADPASGWLSGHAALDDRGFVRTDRALGPDDLDERWTGLGRLPLPFETSHPGLFAVGDVRSGSTKRVAAAVGEGSACVSAVHQHLAYAH
ncbi:MAG TPA: FAD-dependent oxidoreductase [Acidimicrobiales bacterium]|nr:FAD-dependent oxidoreductase [Acidimicrobiales bacterium]